MAVARDVAIIILAVQSIIIGALMMILVWQVYRLVKLLREEIKPLLDSTQDTANTVRGTAEFMGEHVVSPVIRASSSLTGVRQGLRVLFSTRTVSGNRSQQQDSGMDVASTSSPEDHSQKGGKSYG